jgi:AcrR family transcriptional regulator
MSTSADVRTPRSSSASGRSPKRRFEEVLDAAARVFARRGYADASVQDVADELGILKGSLYHYIATKEDLLYWLLEGVHADVELILEEVSQADDLSPLGRIELYARRQVLYNLDNLERISIYYSEVEALSEERLATIRSLRRTHEKFITGLIKQAQADGTADPSADPRILANCLFATIIWTYRWYKPNGHISRSAVARDCARFALLGVVGETPER